ncbi:MAG: S41 family peptidase [Proteobacteria bacterium]|nr:S41 family peptidase [Pseudomonadota bacterium]
MTTRWRGFGLAMAALVMALGGMAGCAMRDLPIVGGSEPRQPGEYSTNAARHIFATGLENIDRMYIDPVLVSTIALHGMQALSSLDPEVKVERNGDTVRLTAGPKLAASYIAPADHDSSGWAAVVAGALGAGRESSEKLRATTVENLYQTVFDGAMHDLDRFSRYVGRSSARDSRASRDGFGGIGIEPRIEEGVVRIGAVLPETPAAKGGLQVGDRITHVDGTALVGMSDRAVIALMRGPEGTDVTLTVARNVQPPFALTLRRARIVPATITYRREAGDIAYFHITGFNTQTSDALRVMVARAKTEIGRNLRGVVLDLRDNPGGYLDQGVGVARLFVNNGRVLTTRGRHPDSEQIFDANQTDILNGLPMVVLINGGSASSAEIVAAALQDLDRAVLIGSSSYGKGTVQHLTTLPNEGELLLTWARLYAPSNYALQRLGVIPNICTSGQSASAAKSIEDLRIGRLDPIAPVSARRGADGLSETAQVALAATCPARTGVNDADLEVARAMLTDPALIRRFPHGSSVAVAR